MTLIDTTTALEKITQLRDRAENYGTAARAPRTIATYRRDWARFELFCVEHGFESLPAEPAAVVLYATGLTDTLKPSSIERRLAAIAAAHTDAGLDSPTRETPVRRVMAGIRREHGVAPRRVAPARIEEVRAMVATLDRSSGIGKRDSALLLVGFGLALRRSELVALDWADIEWNEQGAVVTIRRSKTDQEAEGVRLPLPFGKVASTCPIHALSEWRDVSFDSGPVFRSFRRGDHVQTERLSDQSVAKVVKRTAESAGLDSAQFSGHSLRSGFATTAAAHGVAERNIARQTRHKSMPVLRLYIREGNMWTDTAATEVGL